MKKMKLEKCTFFLLNYWNMKLLCNLNASSIILDFEIYFTIK